MVYTTSFPWFRSGYRTVVTALLQKIRGAFGLTNSDRTWNHYRVDIFETSRGSWMFMGLSSKQCRGECHFLNIIPSWSDHCKGGVTSSPYHCCSCLYHLSDLGLKKHHHLTSPYHFCHHLLIIILFMYYMNVYIYNIYICIISLYSILYIIIFSFI